MKVCITFSATQADFYYVENFFTRLVYDRYRFMRQLLGLILNEKTL
jgi:hypothetical protein